LANFYLPAAGFQRKKNASRTANNSRFTHSPNPAKPFQFRNPAKLAHYAQGETQIRIRNDLFRVLHD
jgi:hypothetical protein